LSDKRSSIHFTTTANGAFSPGDVAIASSSVNYTTNAFSIITPVRSIVFPPTSQGDPAGGDNGDETNISWRGRDFSGTKRLHRRQGALSDQENFPLQERGLIRPMLTFSDNQEPPESTGGPATAFVDIPAWSAPGLSVLPMAGVQRAWQTQINPPRDEDANGNQSPGTITGGSFTITFNSQTTPAIASTGTAGLMYKAHWTPPFGAGVITASATSRRTKVLPEFRQSGRSTAQFAQNGRFPTQPSISATLPALTSVFGFNNPRMPSTGTHSAASTLAKEADNVLIFPGPDMTRDSKHIWDTGHHSKLSSRR